MNKTISVNIGGRVFNIEEAAYQKLNVYLNTIRGYFEGNESADEIISDIELRIAELFMERISEQKQVITIGDVNEIVSIMGKPEDYFDEDGFEEESAPGSRNTQKRVFRDPDNKVLFGVCGGISAYFGWDPIVLRAIFVIFTLFFGSGVLLYLLLALIIPKAKSTAEKLQMRGEPVTVDTISKKVNESFDSVRDDIKDFGDRNKGSVDTAARRIGDFFRDLFNLLAKFIRVFGVVLFKIIGVALLLAGAAGLVGIVAGILGFETFLSLSETGILTEDQVGGVMGSIIGSDLQGFLLKIGALLFLAIPALALLLLGIRIAFDYKRIPGLVGIVMLIFWLTGIGLLVAGGMQTYRDFQVETQFTETLDLVLPDTDTLYLDVAQQELTQYAFSSGFGDSHLFFENGVTFPGLDSTNIMYIGKNRVTVEPNKTDSLYKLKIERSANGSSQKDAINNARQSITRASVEGDSLLIYPVFALGKESKIRNQKVKYIISIPVGKAIHFNKNSGRIIYDVPNVTHTHDRKMLEKTWLMTEGGLKCTTCPEESDEKTEIDLELKLKVNPSQPDTSSAEWKVIS
jgi:phage shock protein PspC (stress-responsive transcriptional regulator)